MIVAEYKGHRLSNAASAIVFYYPRVADGHDFFTDLKAAGENVSVAMLLRIYAAFRMAGDPEARKLTAEELINEVDTFDEQALIEFNGTLLKLLNEKKARPEGEGKPLRD